MKATSILLLEDLENKICKQVKNKVNLQNVAMFYQIAKYFYFTELAKLALCYIERCFTLVCETHTFKNLDLAVIANIVSSSELRIDSEMEVMNAADNWVSHDFEQRSKFASRLLSKVHLVISSCFKQHQKQ